MNSGPNARSQRLCTWAGPLMMVVFGIGFWGVARLIPPPVPSWSATELAGYLTEHQTRIRIGLVIAMLGAALGFGFPVAIMLQLRRIEGPASPLAYLQLVTGLLTPPLFIFPMFAMAASAYRPESRAPEITQALNDLGWLALVGFGGPAILQSIVIAIAVLSDRRADPVFPRWVGYFNVWAALLFLPGLLVICFHTGPFAWNGVFAFWVPLTIFTAWYVVMAAMLLRAISQEEREALPDSGATPVPVGQARLG
ncbi:MAG TPA: hypothetical protein VK735_09565 [Pseudonocardia sp.]|jgi:hypothetical protein|uniref:hypothetical protein n=1 Tax=Pseudonocardia sp. TaxID=60912 RepID=UPI002C52F525|nr:hypothetical protein [Pseudonocardia sp.]HTF47683.1 hypothetical protein [Pseudonocardia sp.]